jgi:hypothetical protein
MVSSSIIRRLFILLLGIFVICPKVAQGDEVDDLLNKVRQALDRNDPVGAISWSKLAMAKCQPDSVNYLRCYFYLGESYFKGFEVTKSKNDAQQSIESFEQVLNIDERSRGKYPQDFPITARLRIRTIRITLAEIELRDLGKSKPFFNVKLVPKGVILARSFKIFVGDENIDNPFCEALFVEDVLVGPGKPARRDVYLSATAVGEVARRLGIQMSEPGEYTYDRYGVMNRAWLFRKSGYPDIVLKNGERFNEHWAVIEYDIVNMPALPVRLFEHFGASIEENWLEHKVTIGLQKLKVIEGPSVNIKQSQPSNSTASKPASLPPSQSIGIGVQAPVNIKQSQTLDSASPNSYPLPQIQPMGTGIQPLMSKPVPLTTDWFTIKGTLSLPSSGGGGNWIIGFQNFVLPEKIYPGQLVQGRVDLLFKDSARDSANAVLYISLFGDWTPDTELARIYHGLVGEPRLVSIPFSFTAPSKPGTNLLDRTILESVRIAK